MYNILINYKFQVFFFYKISCFRLKITAKKIMAAVEGEPNRRSYSINEWLNSISPEKGKCPLDLAGLDREPFHKMLVDRCLNFRLIEQF